MANRQRESSEALGPLLAELIDQSTDQLVALRRELHAYPELAFHEYRTAELIATRLRQLGCDVREEVGQTGVVGRLFGRDGERVIALRADIDGLPIQEENEVPYASRNAGVMHACGHDGHIAILLTAADILSRLRDQFQGEIRFIFQPAEETAGGAPRMLADGAFADPKPQAVYGLHLWNNLPTGVVGIRDGALFANTDEFHLTVRGSGGHGAMPHQTVDPIVVTAQFISALQTMVSRETSPLEPAVVTVGSIHGGTAFNIVPPEVELKGTVRTFSSQMQAQLRGRIEVLARGITSAMRASYDYTYLQSCPAVVNDAAASRLVRRVATRAFGEQRVTVPTQTMGGDDMSYFLNETPGCYCLVGTAPLGSTVSPHHHPRFDIDEAALPVGLRLLAELALEPLER